MADFSPSWTEIRKNLDRPLVVLTLGLFVLGLVALVSASLGVRRNHPEYPMKQLLWGLLGALAYLGVLKVGYQNFLKQAVPLYVGALGLLVALLVLGHAAKGAQSWFHLGPFRLQPSELGKVALGLVLAKHCSRVPPETPRAFLGTLGVAGVSLFLLLLQPDLGSALVYGAMTVVALWVSGAKPSYLACLGGAGLLAFPFAWQGLKTYQKMRLLVFLDPTLDPQGAGYNVIQSRIAVGSGGLVGKGFLAGTQSRLHFLPEPHTDFIFSVFAEEFGFLGCSLVLCLFALLFWRMIKVALQSRDLRAKILVATLSAWLWFQVMESIAMSMGLAPITGLPLPLFSYGGSSLLAEALALGLVQSVAVSTARERFD